MCAASVYPEPGSNSHINGLFTSTIFIAYLNNFLILSSSTLNYFLAVIYSQYFFIDSFFLSPFIGFSKVYYLLFNVLF